MATDVGKAGEASPPDFAKSSALGVVAGFSSSVAAFLSGVIVARMLGVSGTGTTAMALWLIFAAVTLADTGITGALARFLPEAEAVEGRRIGARLLRVFLRLIALGLAVLALIMTFGWNRLFEDALAQSGARLSYGAVILSCFLVHMSYAFGFQYLRGVHGFRTIALGSIAGAVLQVTVVLAGSWLFGVHGALAGYLAGSLPIALVLIRLPIVERRPDRATWQRVRNYALTLWLAALFSPLLWTRIDLALVGTIGGIREAGLFNAASSLTAMLMQACVTLCMAVVPHLASVEPERRPEASGAVMRILLLMLVPMALGMAAIAPRVVRLVYGPDFHDAGGAAIMLSVSAMGTLLTIALSNVINVLEKNSSLVKSGIVGAVLTLGLGFALVPFYGLIGAATARIVAQCTVAAMTLVQANRLQPGTLPYGWFGRLLLAGGACAGAAGGVLGWSLSDWMLVPAIAAGAVAYVLACRLLVPFDPADLDRLGFDGSTPSGRYLGKLFALLSRAH